MKYLEVCLQTSIFAPLFNRKHISLDYGVMVAQQVLVLFVQVRILVVQRKKSQEIFSFETSFVLSISVVAGGKKRYPPQCSNALWGMLKYSRVYVYAFYS